MTLLVDKVMAKSEVARLLGDEWVTPTLYAGSSLPERSRRNWAKPYVLKTNHGSGGNFFVRSAKDEEWPSIELKVDDMLRTTYGATSHEWAYQGVKPQILVEPLIGESLVDYKLFVFGGRVEFIQVHTDRFKDHKASFFDRDWNLQPFGMNWPRHTSPLAAPASLQQMIEGAELLVAGFPFARVDLYEIEKSPRFGEVTFYPDSGFAAVVPDEFDYLLGEVWPTGPVDLP